MTEVVTRVVTNVVARVVTNIVTRVVTRNVLTFVAGATNIGFLCLMTFVQSSHAAESVDRVKVLKHERKMVLFSGTDVISEYHIALGGSPVGHKLQEGDQRTPEGKYTLDYKKSDSAFYKSIHISYPNSKDKEAAKAAGVDPGGFIMIHGQKNGFGWLAPVMQFFDWTDGCIAVTNEEMDEIWDLVKTGATIEILP